MLDWIKEEAESVMYILIGIGIIVPCLLFADGLRAAVNWLWGVNDTNDESH